MYIEIEKTKIKKEARNGPSFKKKKLKLKCHDANETCLTTLPLQDTLKVIKKFRARKIFGQKSKIIFFQLNPNSDNSSGTEAAATPEFGRKLLRPENSPDLETKER